MYTVATVSTLYDIEVHGLMRTGGGKQKQKSTARVGTAVREYITLLTVDAVVLCNECELSENDTICRCLIRLEIYLSYLG